MIFQSRLESDQFGAPENRRLIFVFELRSTVKQGVVMMSSEILFAIQETVKNFPLLFLIKNSYR